MDRSEMSYFRYRSGFCMVSNKIFFGMVVVAFPSAVDALATDLLFSGNHDPVIELIPEKSTGLDKIYVLKELKGVSISIDINISEDVSWSAFSNMGAGYAVPIDNVIQVDGKSTLQTVSGNMGYIVESKGKKYIFWLVDYSKNEFRIDDIELDNDQDCEYTKINFSGYANPIEYFTVNGRKETLSRDIELSYINLVWDHKYNQFEQEYIVKNLQSISSSILITPPLYCSSYFTVSGDRFQKIWNSGISYTSKIFAPNSIMIETDLLCIDEDRNEDNVIVDNGDSNIFSAPSTFLFSSYSTDLVSHIEWQMADDVDFKNITYRINERDFEHTFTKDGITYVRCVGSNDTGSCSKTGETYIIQIGESDLKIPNIFSPNGDGVNDEWKVAYRSLIEYKCWIFDRQGHKLFYCENPSIGWDGNYKGKPVSSGVYYYVIKAKGSDGRIYNKSGDINIVVGRNTVK